MIFQPVYFSSGVKVDQSSLGSRWASSLDRTLSHPHSDWDKLDTPGNFVPVFGVRKDVHLEKTEAWEARASASPRAAPAGNHCFSLNFIMLERTRRKCSLRTCYIPS